MKIVYNYNDDLSLNNFIRVLWLDGKWTKVEKHTNKYNSDGNIESVLWEWFNTSAQEWFKEAKDIYNYDSLGNRNFILHQYFNGQEFVDDYKYENYFKGTNLVLSIHLNWTGNEWVNGFKNIYTYNSENLVDTNLFQIWTNNQWVNYYLINYTYDEKLNRKTILTKIWQEEQWIDYGLTIFEYDVNNNLVLENLKTAQDNNWKNCVRIIYKYDENNNLIHIFGEEWKNGKWVPENEPLKVTNPDGILYAYLAKEIFLFYRNPTSVKNEENIAKGFNLFQNYPNPFNSNTIISYNILERSLIALTIYNLLGEEIKTLVKEEQAPGKYQINFDGSNLPSGIYFYQLSTEKFRQTKKMLLLR